MQTDLFSTTKSDPPPPPAPDGDPDGMRYYQREAITRTLEGFEEFRSQLIVMATGLGKTETFCTIAKHWQQGDVLILAHRDELVSEAARRLRLATGQYVDIEQADLYASPAAHFVSASVQTLSKDRRLHAFKPDRFGLIIIDEGHHAIAPTYRKILEYFPNAKILGVTATADRADEKAMAQAFENVPYVFDIQEGIDAGYLVPLRGRAVYLDEIDLTGVESSAGDLAIAQLDEAMLKAVEGIVKQTIQLEPTRQAVCFFPGVSSAKLAAERFTFLDPERPSAFVSGETDKDERRRIMSDFKSGKIHRLCNCMVATEGFDAPPASCIVNGRPTKSRALYTQMVGRGTRVLRNTVDHLFGPELAAARRAAIAASPKPDCIILDFVGNSGRHSLMGPVDVLGGNFTEEEVAAAKEIAAKEPGGDLKQQLDRARAQLRAVAAKARSQVKARAVNFDPFAVLNLDVGEEERYAVRFGHIPATEQQIETLRKRRVPDNELNGLSKRAAGKLLTELSKRQQAGLATYPQLRQLQRWGVTNKNVAFQDARKALTYLEKNNWGKAPAFDPSQLIALTHPKKGKKK